MAKETATLDIVNQPVSNIQLNQLKIEWVPIDSIQPNKYNPNRMTWHDRQLLKQSLLEDGWTQPIVTLPDRTIVDGEQRWTVAKMEIHPKDVQEVIDKMLKQKEHSGQISESILARLMESRNRLHAAIEEGQLPCLASITGGLVPITVLDLGDDAHKMISTIRHNRARGIHQIDSMAAITKDLMNLGLDLDDLETRLGMDDEEIRRFMQSAEGQLLDLQKELDGTEFSPATRFVHIGDLPQETQALLQKSTAAGEVFREHGEKVAERKREINDLANTLIAEAEAKKKTGLTQEEKTSIIDKVSKSIPDVGPAPKMPELVKLVLFILPEEHDTLVEITKMVGKQVPEGMILLTKFAMDNRNQWSEWAEKQNGSHVL